MNLICDLCILIKLLFVEVYEVGELLGCDSDTLLRSLTQRTVKASLEQVKTDLSSTEVCHFFIAAITYGCFTHLLFVYFVKIVNR